jgi:probable rRNA maturation factor
VSVEVELRDESGAGVDGGAARRVLVEALRREGVEDGEVGLAFVGEAEMAGLNARHRGKEEPTDVLSFPLDGRDAVASGLPRQLGDIVVCPAVAAREGTPLALLVVHGALHLLGWDHERDDGAMLRRQGELAAEVDGHGTASA